MNFLHHGSLGDCVYSVPTIRSINQRQGQLFGKANLYLRPDVPDTARPPVFMTRAEAEKLLPLLQGQQGLGEVALYDGQPIDIDLNQFRKSGFNFARGDVARYYCYAFRCNPCLYRPWLTVEPSPRFKDYLLVNRTKRYNNPNISYNFLSGRPDVIFVGYKDEYTAFCAGCPRLPHVQAENARELASWLAGAKGFIGNQSFCYSLAEAMKVKRLLEIYPAAPNVIIHGPKGADAINQPLFEEWTKELLA